MRYFTPAVWLILAPPLFAGPIKDEVVAPYVEVRTHADQPGGAGTVIEVGGKKLILTAHHVVSEVKGRELNLGGLKTTLPPVVWIGYDRGGRRVEQSATVVWHSPIEEDGGCDLALLLPADDTDLIAAKVLGVNDTTEGEDAWTIGTPGRLRGSLDRTVINRPKFEWTGRPFILVNGNGTYGSSGGGMYVLRGGVWHLAGVVVRMHHTGNPKSPLMCQTPETIGSFLKSYVEAKK